MDKKDIDPIVSAVRSAIRSATIQYNNSLNPSGIDSQSNRRHLFLQLRTMKPILRSLSKIQSIYSISSGDGVLAFDRRYGAHREYEKEFNQLLNNVTSIVEHECLTSFPGELAGVKMPTPIFFFSEDHAEMARLSNHENALPQFVSLNDLLGRAEQKRLNDIKRKQALSRSISSQLKLLIDEAPIKTVTKLLDLLTEANLQGVQINRALLTKRINSNKGDSHEIPLASPPSKLKSR